MTWNVYNSEGQRKYLTSNEIEIFLKCARRKPMHIRAFCLTMAYTGCRISEALSMTMRNIDFESKQIVIRCLKKRGDRVFRAIPIPQELMKLLENWVNSIDCEDDLLWPWSRMTGYRRICEVMEEAGIRGSYATPKGLRHGFGVRAIQSSVPLTLVQRWLGHANIKTTAIYTGAMGPEEREIAARMWRNGATGNSPVEERRLWSNIDVDGDPGLSTVDSVVSLSHNRASKPQQPISQRRRGSPAAQLKMKENGLGGRLKRMLTCSLLQFWLKRRAKNPYDSIEYPSLIQFLPLIVR